MIRAVLDTNVVVSAHLEERGPEALILSLAIGGFFRCFVSEELFREYQEVLIRPKFGFDKERTARSLKAVRKGMRIVRPSRRLDITRDRDDNMVLECALEARADYVVTGNLRHFPKQFQDIRVVAPKQFLTAVAAEPGQL
jgi:uncharacterized protein